MARAAELYARRERGRFGDRLRKLRRQAGLTQDELANRSGLDPRLISLYENAKQPNPTLDTLLCLAHGLGVKPEQFFSD